MSNFDTVQLFSAAHTLLNLEILIDVEAKTFDKKLSTYEYLAERKGMSVEQAIELHSNVTEMARNIGLTYNFDQSFVANSFDAHKLIQLAKTKGLGDAAEEQLFKAYFTDGKDMSNHSTLIELGKEKVPYSHCQQ